MHGFSRPLAAENEIGCILVSAVDRTNRYIAENHSKANMFATVFAAVLEKDRDDLYYLNCGHDAPILIRNNRILERLNSSSAAIGVFADLKSKCERISLAEADSVVAFTDGVTDARSREDELFGEGLLLDILTTGTTMKSRMERLKQAINAHIGRADQFDDIILIGFQRIRSE